MTARPFAPVTEFIDRYQSDDGIGNESFEQTLTAKNTLRVMRAFYDVFKDDPMVADGSGMKELRVEYFILSTYLLLRHLLLYYVWDTPERQLFQSFVIYFHQRWSDGKADDADIQLFSNKRQQTGGEISVRDQIIRQAFFEYAAEKGENLKTKDDRRAFSEAERIKIYRRDDGRCQQCVGQGKPDKECIVLWSEYDADHVIPYSLGGKTIIGNAQVLCRYHNQQKGGQPVPV